MKDFYLGGEKFIYYKKNNFLKNKKTLVFVHGLSGTSSAWVDYEKKFEKNFNVLSFDLRGHGKSFRPKKLKDYTIEKFSEDLYKIVKKEKINNLALIGHSFGNLIVLDFFKKHKKFVNSLILISIDASPAKRKFNSIIVPFLEISRLMNYLPVLKKTGGHIDYTKYLNTGDWNVRRMIADVSNTGLRSFLFSTYHAYKFDMEEYLKKIKVPTLIIHGYKDTIFPIASGKRAHNLMRNSKFVVFKDSNHIIVLNDFVKLSKEINRFVDNLK
jgi:pimeloyl-ACP methyl ester carboxylesterase